jgi:hypothetical protein
VNHLDPRPRERVSLADDNLPDEEQTNFVAIARARYL